MIKKLTKSQFSPTHASTYGEDLSADHATSTLSNLYMTLLHCETSTVVG